MIVLVLVNKQVQRLFQYGGAHVIVKHNLGPVDFFRTLGCVSVCCKSFTFQTFKSVILSFNM